MKRSPATSTARVRPAAAAAHRPDELRYGLLPGLRLRGLDEGARRADFVAATQNPVETSDGPEYLVMAGVDLTRYAANPVVLDAHNRSTTAAVIGSADVRVQGPELLADVTFAETEPAETAWQLVAGGFVRAVSVGYLPTETVVLREGESYALDGQTITGPALIRTRWQLYEISLVPVPADFAAVRRAFLDQLPGAPQSAGPGQESHMSDTQSPPAAAVAPASTPETLDHRGGAPGVEAGAPPPPPLDAAAVRARAEAIRALAPEGLRALADELVLDASVSVDAARQRLAKAHAERLAPVGTPATSGYPQRAAPQESALSGADVVAAIRCA